MPATDSEHIAMQMRWPLEIHEKVRALADTRKRSFHAQVLFMVEKYLTGTLELDIDVGANIECPHCAASIFIWDEREDIT